MGAVSWHFYCHSVRKFPLATRLNIWFSEVQLKVMQRFEFKQAENPVRLLIKASAYLYGREISPDNPKKQKFLFHYCLFPITLPEF
jgi:hypothetical protein